MVDVATRPVAAGVPTSKATTTATFSADVLAGSAQRPVLVHFLSSRSEACRTLQAALERVVQSAEGRVRLMTMDIDTDPQIASRLGIQGVPAVYAFQRGQPVDGFMGVLPEPEIRGFLERLIGPLGDAAEEALAEAEAAFTAGDLETAAAIYSAVLEQDPEHPAASGGLARCFVAAGDLASARQLLDGLPPAANKDNAVITARAALDLADQASSVGDLAGLRQKVEADPDDHQSRFDLAVGLAAQGKKEEAADQLIASLKQDRTWNDGAARKQLLQFFEAWGLMDSVTLAARRKLSTLLFS